MDNDRGIPKMGIPFAVQMVREKIGILWKKQCHFWRQNGEYNEKI